MKRTTFGLKSFTYYGAHFWISLPVGIKSAVTLGNLKTLAKNCQGPSCHCSVCQLVIEIDFTDFHNSIHHMFNYFTVYSILSISRGTPSPKIRKDAPWGNRMGDIWASLWVHSMTRTSSHPCVFLIDIVLYWLRFVESLQYLHQWNTCFVYMLYGSCLYDIYIYIYKHTSEYLHDEIFLNVYFRFFFKQIGSSMGPALSSQVAPQVVITTSGAAWVGRMGFWELSIVQCSMYTVHSWSISSRTHLSSKTQ